MVFQRQALILYPCSIFVMECETHERLLNRVVITIGECPLQFVPPRGRHVRVLHQSILPFLFTSPARLPARCL